MIIYGQTLVEHFHDFMRVLGHPLGLVGLLGQTFFFSRFLVQWIASEKKGRSTIPVSFWYLSLAAAMLMLVYAIWREDPVLTIGQLVGFFVYVRNLVLIRRHKGALDPSPASG